MTSHPRYQPNFKNRSNRKQSERIQKSTSPLVPKTYDYSDYLQENDYNTENEYIESDERSSNESLSMCDVNVNSDGTGDVDPRYRDFSPETKRDKLAHDAPYPQYQQDPRIPEHLNANYQDYRPNTQRKVPPVYGDKKGMYEPMIDPQSAMATQKLQKLRELQRRRDLTEKYYSNEIRRLIGEQYYEAKIPSPLYSRPERSYAQNYAGDRAMPSTSDNLEPCGTMTTLTRLDCGCVERILRPIFTTPSGQVLQKHSCSPDHPYNHVLMTTPNTRLYFPHPHMRHHPPTPGPMPPSPSKLKSKSFGEQYQSQGAASTAPANPANQTPPTVSRGISPNRKISDSAVYSA